MSHITAPCLRVCIERRFCFGDLDRTVEELPAVRSTSFRGFWASNLWLFSLCNGITQNQPPSSTLYSMGSVSHLACTIPRTAANCKGLMTRQLSSSPVPAVSIWLNYILRRFCDRGDDMRNGMRIWLSRRNVTRTRSARSGETFAHLSLALPTKPIARVVKVVTS